MVHDVTNMLEICELTSAQDITVYLVYIVGFRLNHGQEIMS